MESLISSAASENRVKTEQVNLLYQNASMVIWGSVLMAVILVGVFWQQISRPVLLTWFAIVTAISLLRILIISRYHASPENRKPVADWGSRYAISATIAGVVWGTGYFLFFLPAEPEFVLFAACMYVGMISAATMSLTAFMPAYYNFVILATAPISVRMMLEGGNIYPVIGLAYWLYLGVSLFFGRNINRLIIRSIELRFENRELLENLQEQKDSAEQNQRVAEKAVLAKNRFLAAASHDLRQPLHALGLFHGALDRYVPSREGRELLDNIDQSTGALNHIFNSLLDVSRLDAGMVEVNTRHLPLHPLLEGIQTAYKSHADAKGVGFDYEPCREVVYSDPVLLERILRNLLSNAINYTDSGRVTLDCQRAGANMLVIRVTDTGIGIPDEEMDKIFSEYHQVNNPERDRNKGLGLGLAIVSRLCDLLKANLEVKSKPGEGTRFTLSIPLGNPDRVVARIEAGPVLDLAGTVVLVIDDDQHVLEGMQGLLSGWGCRTVLAESAVDAIGKIESRDLVPDFIFADFRLRGHETGTQAIETICEEFNKTIPAVIVTGDTSKDRLKEAVAKGLPLLHKPVTPGEVRTALVRGLSG